jgi:2-keto-3-deoxy-L-rhamnonate aldolase RhmA
VKDNPVKRKLEAGGRALGTLAGEMRSPHVAAIFCAAGFDFFIIDSEHGSYDLETIADVVLLAKAKGIVPLVRVPDAEYHLLARSLDTGAMGLMVPRVETREQVERIIQSAKYPPWGRRGCAMRGAITDYESAPVAETMERVNRQTLIIVQIESRTAVENLDDMLSVEGVDVALIGPNDLSISYGVPGQYEHPDFEGAAMEVIEASNRHGVAPGIHFQDAEPVERWIGRGMRAVTIGGDARFLMAAARATVERLRPKVEGGA